MKGMKLVVSLFLSVALVLTGISMAQGATSGSRANVSAVVSALTADEEAGLLRMREEEKLARDVYKDLHTKWNSKIFYNISLSEQNHMDAVKGLLEKYGINDPSAGKDATIQDLYYDLTPRGENSLEEAVCVGVIIEEMDIHDLTALLKNTNKYDILRVYNNLLNGSLNHLDAFSSHSSYNSDTCEGYRP